MPVVHTLRVRVDRVQFPAARLEENLFFNTVQHPLNMCRNFFEIKIDFNHEPLRAKTHRTVDIFLFTQIRKYDNGNCGKAFIFLKPRENLKTVDVRKNEIEKDDVRFPMFKDFESSLCVNGVFYRKPVSKKFANKEFTEKFIILDNQYALLSFLQECFDLFEDDKFLREL